MKNPLKKSTPEPLRRQRARREQQDVPTPSFSNYGRRDQDAQVPRQSSQRSPLAGRTTEHVKNFWMQRFGLSILLLALLVSAVNIITLSTKPKILPLNAQTSLLRDPQIYQDEASSLLKQSFSSRSKLTINTTNIAQQLTNKFPEIGSAQVTVPLVSHRPIIYIQAARPALVLSASTGSFMISSAGKVLAPSSQSVSSLRNSLPMVSDQSGIALTPNAQALTSDSVHFIETVAAQLKAKNYTVSGMTLPREAGELEVQIANQPYTLKFNIQANTPKEQVGTFFATMSQLQKQHTTPVKYVDVRVEGRAYYQ